MAVRSYFLTTPRPTPERDDPVPRPANLLAKVTSKNQLTLPKAALEALGYPTHFRVQVHDGALVLWPGLLVTEPEAAKMIGLDAQALRDARRSMRERGVAVPQPPGDDEPAKAPAGAAKPKGGTAARAGQGGKS